jgi:diguanylate cyclase (GGDEF)-like protein/PAS domain S-box-containing protein
MHGTIPYAARAIRTNSLPQNQPQPSESQLNWTETTGPPDDLLEVARERRIDAATLDKVVESVLIRYPRAPVATMGAEGLCVPMPDSIPSSMHPVLVASSGLDLVIHEDRLKVLASWDQMLAGGAARCPVHLVDRPDVTVGFTGFDLRERHGVILAVFVPSVQVDTPAPAPPAIKAVPRFARVRKSPLSVIIEIDEATTQILGWTAEEMVGRRAIEFMHPDDHALAIENWMDMLASPGPGRRVRLRHRRRDESWVWFEVSNHNLIEDPDHECVVSELVDISEEMAAHDEIRARKELLDRLAEAMPLGLLQVDADRQVIYTNDRLHEIVGVERCSHAYEQLRTVVEQELPMLEGAFNDVLGEGRAVDLEVEFCVGPSHELRFCTIGLRALYDTDRHVTGAIACVADVTDSARMRDELKKRATFDELTGCYNRASIMQALTANMAGSGSECDRAVMFIDLDDFKEINDRHGHQAGDELLRIASKRLRGEIRAGDMVGRIGGDEFLLVCPNIGGPGQAMKLAERLAKALREDVDLTSTRLSHVASIGVAWSTGDEVSSEILVARADQAMYDCKREGTGQPKLASEEPQIKAHRREPAGVTQDAA